MSDIIEPGQKDDSTFLYTIFLLVSGRRTIALCALLSLALGVLTSFLLRPDYTATAVILPPTQQSSASALLGQLGTLSALGGGASALGIKSPADMYVGFLSSRTIADKLIDRFQLQKVYKQKTLYDTRKALSKHTDISAEKDSMIHITVTDHDAQRASDIANGYVEGLYALNSNLAITEAAQRRIFYEKQVADEKQALEEAEDEFRAMQQKTGMIQITGQAQSLIQSIAQMRAQIATREVELQSLLGFSTEQNPEVERLRTIISATKTQLARLEDDQQHQMKPGDISIPAGRVPEDSLEYMRTYREVSYHQTLFGMLSKQYEVARIDEAKSAQIIQIVDRAVPSDKKSGPPRMLLTLAFVLTGITLSGCYLVLKDHVSELRSNPQTANRFLKLEAQLRRS